jgi:hypothetical protein
VNAQLPLHDVDQSQRVALAQFFTPAWLADRMVSWIGPLLRDATQRAYTLRILEPSAGRGALLAPLLARCPGASIDAVELDSAHARALSAFPVRVDCCDYLTRPAPLRRYDVSISNVPFTAGAECDHIAKQMDESERLISQLPIRALHGDARYRAIWSRFGLGGDWHIRRIAYLVDRPYPNASDDIVVLDLRRVPGSCDAIEWWRS